VLVAEPTSCLVGIATAVIDPYAGYARGLAEGLPAARLVVDHFNAVRLANRALDEVPTGAAGHARPQRPTRRPELEGEDEGGSIEVEERHVMAARWRRPPTPCSPWGCRA